LPFLFGPFINGDLGVDIFFVLSGFLISFILLKETDKYEGKIDVLNFYRSRCIRLWFAMVPYLLLAAFVGAPMGYYLPVFFFIGNLVGGQRNHLWSVSVEFQFYIISPFIVYWMKRGGSAPWVAAAFIATMSTIARCVIGLTLCGDEIFTNNEEWLKPTKC
jgi:peptidoglycan/LPS O-acetylase OafA/YrhL